MPDPIAPRVLIIEHDLPVANHLSEVLQAAGFRIQNIFNFADFTTTDLSGMSLAIVDARLRDRKGHQILDFIKTKPDLDSVPILALADHPVDVQSLPRNCGDQELLGAVQHIIFGEKPLPLIKHEKHDAATDPELLKQLTELKTLSQLGRSISSVLDLNEVLNQIVEAATTLTRAEEGMLLLPDESGKTLYIRAMKGVDDDSARSFRIKMEDPFVGNVYTSGEPILVEHQGPQRVKTEYFVKSLLYVPIKYKGHVIGILGVNNRHVDRGFGPHDQELLVDLAAYAATAIENARLYEKSLRQNRQLTILVQAGQAINSTLSLHDVLFTICREVIQALDVNACLVSQHDELTDELHSIAGSWHAVWRADQGPTSSIDDRPVLKQALSQNAFYVITDEQMGPKWRTERERLERLGAEQMLMLPIRPGNHPAIGIIEFYYRGPMPQVTDEFRAQIRNMALEISVLVTQPQASGAFPQQAILQKAEKLLELSGGNWFCLSLIATGERLTRIVQYGTGIFLDDTRPQEIPFPADMSLFATNEPVCFHVGEDQLPKYIAQAMTGYGALSILCLPLPIKGRAFVIVVYDTLNPQRFQPDEVSLAWALISQAVIAIENARLYRDLEHSLSELKQAHASLVQATRLSTMGQLAAVVAHQINNPLTTIMVDAEIILQDLTPNEPMYEGVMAIHRSGQRAHAVVKRLLSTARRSPTDETANWIDLHETIRNTLDLVTTHIERSKIKLELDLDTSQPAQVLALAGHLEDVWLNLLLNAHDALIDMPNATIKVSSRREGDTFKVSICDNGPGIAPDNIDYVFNAFFTTKPVGEGTGLGLYVCKQIIDQCQGTITIDTKLDEGTCFHVALPVRPL